MSHIKIGFAPTRQRNSKKRRSTDFSCHTATSARNTNVPALRKTRMCRCCFGVRSEPNGVRLRDTHRSCFTPEMDNTEREARYNGWQKAVRQVLTH